MAVSDIAEAWRVLSFPGPDVSRQKPNIGLRCRISPTCTLSQMAAVLSHSSQDHIYIYIYAHQIWSIPKTKAFKTSKQRHNSWTTNNTKRAFKNDINLKTPDMINEIGKPFTERKQITKPAMQWLCTHQVRRYPHRYLGKARIAGAPSLGKRTTTKPKMINGKTKKSFHKTKNNGTKEDQRNKQNNSKNNNKNKPTRQWCCNRVFISG